MARTGSRVCSLLLAIGLIGACGGDDTEPAVSEPEAPIASQPSDEDLRSDLRALLSDVPLDDSGIECAIDAVLETVDETTAAAMAMNASTDALPKAQLDVVTDAVVACS